MTKPERSDLQHSLFQSGVRFSTFGSWICVCVCVWLQTIHLSLRVCGNCRLHHHYLVQLVRRKRVAETESVRHAHLIWHRLGCVTSRSEEFICIFYFRNWIETVACSKYVVCQIENGLRNYSWSMGETAWQSFSFVSLNKETKREIENFIECNYVGRQ